jgi:signal transduction histidine kinase
MVVFTLSAMHSLWISALGVPSLGVPSLGISSLGISILAVLGPAALVLVLHSVRVPRPARSALVAELLPGGTFMAKDDSELDVASEIRTVLSRLEQRARAHHVRLKIAVQPGLVTRAEVGIFRQALSDLIEHALQRSPGGEVLVTAGRHGGRVQVGVSDAGVTDPPPGEGALRATSQLLALHGGTLELDPHPGEGLTAIMRLPEARAVCATPNRVDVPTPGIAHSPA